jgi:hypothetical protein
MPDERRQRVSAGASSVLGIGRRSTSKIPAYVSASTLTSIVDAVANSRGFCGATSCSA